MERSGKRNDMFLLFETSSSVIHYFTDIFVLVVAVG